MSIATVYKDGKVIKKLECDSITYNFDQEAARVAIIKDGKIISYCDIINGWNVDFEKETESPFKPLEYELKDGLIIGKRKVALNLNVCRRYYIKLQNGKIVADNLLYREIKNYIFILRKGNK